MRKTILFLFVFILSASITFAFKGVLKDFTENTGEEDINTPYIYYFEDIMTNFGGEWQQPVNAHKGKQYFLQTTTPPGTDGYIASFKADIKKGDGGEYYLMASMIPMGVPYGSPVQIFLDGVMIADYISDNQPSETGNKAYGVSSSLKWNNFGVVNLSEGAHTFNFVVKTTTAMTPDLYVEGYDAFALVKKVPMPNPKWEDYDVPLFFNGIKPPQKPTYSYWAEAEDAKQNAALTDMADAYNGKQLFVQNDRKDNFIEYEINVDKPGKYLIMAVTGPVGAVHVSPVDLYVDDYLVGSFNSRPVADMQWGWSGICKWVSYGVVDLSADTHSFKFTCYKNRVMDKLMIQAYDAICLVDYNILNVQIEATPDSQPKISGHPKDTIKVKLNPTLTKINLSEKNNISIPIKLMKDGFLVKEYLATFDVDPKKNGEPISIAFDMEVPFDAPNGDFYLESEKIKTPNNAHLLDLSVEGNFATPKEKPLVAENLTLSGGTITAGKEFTCKLSVDFKEASNSDILTVIFEQKKDVAYYATSIKVPEMLGAKGHFESDVTFTLPQDMPKGQVKGLLSLNKDISQSVSPEFIVNSNYTNDTTGEKPLSYGFFKDITGMTQVWYSNKAHTLFWNGEPWMKISCMFNGPYLSYSATEEDFEGFKKNVQRIKSYGITHIYLFTQGPMASRPPYQWETIMDYLEQEGMTYVIGFPNGAGKTTPLRVRQVRANEKKAKIEKNIIGKFQKTIKGSDYEMGRGKVTDVRCTALNGEGKVVAVKNADIVETGSDFVVIECDFGNTQPLDVVIDTAYDVDWCTDNPWKDYKNQSEATAEFIKASHLRPGFRGFVDLIMSNERGLYNAVEPIFVASPEFLKIRCDSLKAKYKNIQTLKKAWMVKGDFVKTFEDAAALYPVYNNGKSLYLVCDTENKNKEKEFSYKTIEIDAVNSPYWYEYLEMRDTSYGDLEDLMVDNVKEVCDAPVNIKLCGMPEIYDFPRQANRKGLDGVGCETYATGEGHITYNIGYRFNEMEAAKKNMIGYSTEMARGWGDDMYPNYPSIHDLFYDMGVSHYMTSKITYLFLYDVLPQTLYERNRIQRDPRIMEWMNLWQEILDDKADFIKDYKPTVYTSWPKPDAWWPSCSERRAVKETDDAYGVNSVKCSNGVWEVATVDPFAKSEVTFVTLNDNPGTDYYKADFEKLLKLNDREIVMLGHRKNLGALSVDKYYTDNYFSDDKYEYQELKVPKDAEILQEENGKVWAMKVGKLQIIAAYPKKNFNALEDLVKYAKLPKPAPTTKDASDFLENGLGITFATFGNNAFKAVEYTLGGKDVVVLHSTKDTKEVLTFTATKDCVYMCPYLNINKEMKAGETVITTLPGKETDSQSEGAGLGYVKIIGEKLSDIQLLDMSLDTLPKASGAGYEVSALPAGLTLPTPKRTNEFKYNTTEVMKAKAGFDTALDCYLEGNYANAQQFLEEYLPLAGEDLSASFNIFLGNISLLRGKAEEAKKYYDTALLREPGNGDAMCGLGCALYATDKEKAIELWKGANTEEAKANLSVE